MEVDLILKTENKLSLFEIKSGKSLNEEFTKNMQKFHKLYPDNISDEKVQGTVIYSGEDYASYKNFAYINFCDICSVFENKTKPFVLNF